MIGFETILEGLVAVLLLATIVYAILLNRKLNALRQGRSQFEDLVKDLNQAIARAEEGTGAFRKLSEGSAQRLEETVREARALREELGRLVHRGAALADELSGVVKQHPRPSAARPLFPDRGEAADFGAGEEGELPLETREKLRRLIDTLR
jgi:ABC-type transporter Mla subunit MlaD